MSRTLSAYLDLIRFLAAMVVFVAHAAASDLSGEWLQPADQFGHLAVIVFFVLSGFVIAYVADQRETTLKSYAIARSARLYSVCLPAVFLVPLIDLAGTALDSSLYTENWHEDGIAKTILLNLLFLNELWFSRTPLFSNAAFWSLGYEAWYYILFGAAFYLRGVARFLFVLLFSLLAGPKILILLPVWLFGVFAYRRSVKDNTPDPHMRYVFLASLAITVGFICLTEYMNFGDFKLLEAVHVNAGASAYFLRDLALGLLVAFNFVVFSKVPEKSLTWLIRAQPAIRALAGISFTLYVFHAPLLRFFGAMIEEPNRSFLVMSLTLLTVIPLAMCTEHRKADLATFIEKGLAFASRPSQRAG